MSTTIDFEAVVSNSASSASGVEEPLGSLAGRGFNHGNKGGKIVIKCNEPCYIIGIASITPNVDYSQGNDWDMMVSLLVILIICSFNCIRFLIVVMFHSSIIIAIVQLMNAQQKSA